MWCFYRKHIVLILRKVNNGVWDICGSVSGLDGKKHSCWWVFC